MGECCFCMHPAHGAGGCDNCRKGSGCNRPPGAGVARALALHGLKDCITPSRDEIDRLTGKRIAPEPAARKLYQEHRGRQAAEAELPKANLKERLREVEAERDALREALAGAEQLATTARWAYDKLTSIEQYGEHRDNPLPALLRGALAAWDESRAALEGGDRGGSS